MKTRFTPLVKLKKTAMDKSEGILQKANADLNSAKVALEKSYETLDEITSPQHGNMREFLTSRELLNSARGFVKHNQEWIVYAQDQVNQAKEKLKLDTIEHEKFKYLELQEANKELKRLKIQEMKDLDEVALMTHNKKERN
ncbi:MAG: flagellar export protein FliJ [Sulfurimonas sp.]|uniref:flagellar export protein FliJ n=1 Tax=Sulfurimonas sp. TaxID=2022749 RepID=UPI0025DC761D|nr:flagellar export protein FliJ [Sulfurimonas sp.]MCK9492159.1 flagellar export protein FliJ [Sulfurimonas sp.]